MAILHRFYCSSLIIGWRAGLGREMAFDLVWVLLYTCRRVYSSFLLQLHVFIVSHIFAGYCIALNLSKPIDSEQGLHCTISLLLVTAVVIPLRQFGSRHPLRCYSKITFK